jgi:anthranilate phosphoribosyltransferase
MQFNKLFQKIYNGRNLDAHEATRAFKSIMSGKINNSELAAFLVTLSLKGVSSAELLSAVKVIRSKSTKIKSSSNIVDTCGTGGDKKNTLNISTATAILAAASGVKVAKHGNKSVSSKSGSSDVLDKLGVNINSPIKSVEKSLSLIDLCFLMAPLYHKAMKNVAEVRALLKVPTIFNILGPLLNPANAKIQLIGVYSKDWLIPIANCLKELKIKRAWIVNGQDGLDEITTTCNTNVIEVYKGNLKSFKINPVKLGIKKIKLEEIKGKTASYNANQIIKLFSNKSSNKAYEDIVVLNTAAVLVIAGKCKSLKEGIALSRKNIINGNAQKKLIDLRRLSNL